jgi:hypothetical protein
MAKHLGQIFTVVFVLGTANSQILALGKTGRIAGSIGLPTVTLVTVGTG